MADFTVNPRDIILFIPSGTSPVGERYDAEVKIVLGKQGRREHTAQSYFKAVIMYFMIGETYVNTGNLWDHLQTVAWSQDYLGQAHEIFFNGNPDRIRDFNQAVDSIATICNVPKPSDLGYGIRNRS